MDNEFDSVPETDYTDMIEALDAHVHAGVPTSEQAAQILARIRNGGEDHTQRNNFPVSTLKDFEALGYGIDQMMVGMGYLAPYLTPEQELVVAEVIQAAGVEIYEEARVRLNAGVEWSPWDHDQVAIIREAHATAAAALAAAEQEDTDE